MPPSPRLLEWDELPPSQQEGNHFIQTGYRPPADSVKDCYGTWRYLHNEIINIFSHVFGSALFALLPLATFLPSISPHWSSATSTEIAVITLYFAGVSICFFLSTAFHTLLCHRSRQVSDIGMQLDFQGVLLLMWSATLPMIYYGFICDSTARWVYWGLQTGLALAASAFTLQTHFKNPADQILRALAFDGFAMSTLVPIVHGVVRYGWEVQRQRMGLAWVGATLALNSIGAMAYACKFPERYCPQTFDVFGASHQILHVAVVCAGICYAIGILQAFNFLHEPGDTCLSTG